MKKKHQSQGFTLIELMIVVAIIGILAAIAIPQFANLVSKSQEGRCKANLGTIRSALSIYYGDTEGWYPANAAGSNLSALTVGSRYLQSVPLADLPATSNNVGHGSTSTETVSAGPVPGDVGGWAYDNVNGDTNWGKVVVACTHHDLRGSAWSGY